LIIALYNSPHTSPLQANSSVSTYKRLFASSSSIPSASNNFLSSRPLPKDLTSSVLPRLITRRPAQRMTAKEFQQSAYFDNILISTIRFLDALPAKTPNEKAQFMRYESPGFLNPLSHLFGDTHSQVLHSKSACSRFLVFPKAY
jgi:SCY1-like protein 2